MKKGFTLLEMLIVIGIVAALVGASVVSFSKIGKVGENAKARELVSHAATALTALFDKDGVWPAKIRALGQQGGLLDENIAYCIKDHFSLTVDDTKEAASGNDRFGIVTPWAQSVIRRQGSRASSSTKVSGSSTVRDHILHFAVDLNGDGIIENVSLTAQGGNAKSSGKGISVRATAIVWCCGRDGEILDYETGIKKDGIYSWSYGQTQEVK